MYFDTHCHLNDPQLYQNIDEIYENARKAGVARFLIVGWDKESSLLAIKISEQYEGCYAAIGYHPENVFDVTDEEFAFMEEAIKHPKVVCVGEIGLDYHWTKEPEKREIQKQWFIKQIEFANKHNMPISVHNRDAFEDCLKILKEHTPKAGGIMHCYSGSVDSMYEVIKLGMYISLGGPLTFTNAKTPKEVCEEVPLNKLLVETDCPYLAPHPLRGTVNEPKNVGLVVDEVARLRNEGKKHIVDVLYENANNVFHV